MRFSSDEPGTEADRPAGPVSDSGLPLTGESSESSPPAGDAGQDQGAGRLEEDFDALLADAQKERDEYLELAQRTKADFENYRKRVAADAQAAQVRGKAEVAHDVIEAVDNLERALETADGEGGEGLAAGVEMVLGGLRETLRIPRGRSSIPIDMRLSRRCRLRELRAAWSLRFCRGDTRLASI